MTLAMPCALAIGGLDPGGGAGVVADLRAFSVAAAFGAAVAAVSTVQSTAGMRRARAAAARDVVAEAREVLRHQRVTAVKVGALGTAANVRAVAALLGRHPGVAVVVDTPMVPTRGKARLLDRQAVTALRRALFPRATVVTVNVDEAEALLGEEVRTLGAAHDAARALLGMGARAAVVKGGHLDGGSATDVLAVEDEVVELRARRLRLPAGGIHGTGCTFASLIAGRLATRRGTRVTRDAILDAVLWAKRVHHGALGSAARVGDGALVLPFV